MRVIQIYDGGSEHLVKSGIKEILEKDQLGKLRIGDKIAFYLDENGDVVIRRV